jgi:HAD superfamily hydrolase (TIGR01490 family)
VSRVIAFFDFDGTVTKKDSLLEFIKYCKGKWAFYFGFAIHAPALIAYKLQLISNHRAKEIMLGYYFGKMPVEKFNFLCEKFTSEVLPSLIRAKAIKEIDRFKQIGAEVVIVSASPENWLSYWCGNSGLKWLATRMDIAENKITGRIKGRNCHGQEKVRRIREAYNLADFSSVYCYGDTSGDRPMLALGNVKFYKPFR